MVVEVREEKRNGCGSEWRTTVRCALFRISKNRSERLEGVIVHGTKCTTTQSLLHQLANTSN